MKPTILFIMWVTWSGKTTLLNESWILDHEWFVYVPSLTTRSLREWEVNGEKYRHITTQEFENNIQEWNMLEYAHVHQTAYYGTTLEWITAPCKQWKIATKEIETQWLIKIIEEWKVTGQFISIFLDIPEKILEWRLQERWTTDPTEVQKRIQSSYQERKDATQYCDIILDASWTKQEVAQAFWESINKQFPNIIVPKQFQ
jgi:guanylate kinase